MTEKQFYDFLAETRSMTTDELLHCVLDITATECEHWFLKVNMIFSELERRGWNDEVDGF